MQRAWIEVDLDALRTNATLVAARCRVPLLPMVKANAYGLGAVAVARALLETRPWGFGVATVEEGAELRDAGIELPIVLFTPPLPESFPRIRSLKLTPALGDPVVLSCWIESGGGRWHLAIDTGMNRAGVRWDRVRELVALLEQCPPEGAFTHFHSAERRDGSREIQENRFEQALAVLPQRPKHLHAENSPAIEDRAPSRWDLARPGVFLYGVASRSDGELVPRPVAHLRGRVVELRDVEEGETVSYGATWRATGRRRIATVAAGYADGVRRSLGNRGFALLRGSRVPIAGVVTMDMTLLDVTEVQCSRGDVVTFLGSDGGAMLDPNEVAALAGASPYEILVGLGHRVPRLYR